MSANEIDCSWQSGLSNETTGNVNVLSATIDIDLRNVRFDTIPMPTILLWLLPYFKELYRCHFNVHKYRFYYYL